MLGVLWEMLVLLLYGMMNPDMTHICSTVLFMLYFLGCVNFLLPPPAPLVCRPTLTPSSFCLLFHPYLILTFDVPHQLSASRIKLLSNSILLGDN